MCGVKWCLKRTWTNSWLDLNSRCIWITWRMNKCHSPTRWTGSDVWVGLQLVHLIVLVRMIPFILCTIINCAHHNLWMMRWCIFVKVRRVPMSLVQDIPSIDIDWFSVLFRRLVLVQQCSWCVQKIPNVACFACYHLPTSLSWCHGTIDACWV